MKDTGSLCHTKWECKYHVVFIPKYRKKALYYELRQHLGELFRDLAAQKECRIEEGHLMPDHVHMLISIPPKYSVSQIVGFIKGKSANTFGEAKLPTSREPIKDGGRTLPDKAFGQGGTMFRPWGEMRR
jgi:REP element-mobilizing transposase RayT